MASVMDKLRSVVTGGASETLKKAKGNQFEACPTCGNVTAKGDPRAAAKDIDSTRKKMSRGNMGE